MLLPCVISSWLLDLLKTQLFLARQLNCLFEYRKPHKNWKNGKHWRYGYIPMILISVSIVVVGAFHVRTCPKSTKKDLKNNQHSLTLFQKALGRRHFENVVTMLWTQNRTQTTLHLRFKTELYHHKLLSSLIISSFDEF